MTIRTFTPIWKEGLAIVPLAVTLLVMRYVGTVGSDCYFHEGVAWVQILVGFPCFVLSLAGAVLLVFSVPAPTVLRTLTRLVIAVAVPAVYVIPFAIADVGRHLEAIVCGAR